MLNMPSSEELDTLFQAFKRVLTHPEFLKALEEVQNLPEAQRSQAASTQLTPQVLAARGIPIPQGMSITTHNFEGPSAPTISAVEVGTMTANMTGAGAPRVCIQIFGHDICLHLPAPLPGTFEK